MSTVKLVPIVNACRELSKWKNSLVAVSYHRQQFTTSQMWVWTSPLCWFEVSITCYGAICMDKFECVDFTGLLDFKGSEVVFFLSRSRQDRGWSFSSYLLRKSVGFKNDVSKSGQRKVLIKIKSLSLEIRKKSHFAIVQTRLVRIIFW